MKTNKKGTKKGINQEVINTPPTPPTEGIGQEVIDNVQGPTTGNEPTPLPAPAQAAVTITDAIELLMSIMEQAPGGALTVSNEVGTQINIAIPKPKPQSFDQKSASGGQMVADFPRAATINPQDLMILLQDNVDKVVPFQVLSNAMQAGMSKGITLEYDQNLDIPIADRTFKIALHSRFGGGSSTVPEDGNYFTVARFKHKYAEITQEQQLLLTFNNTLYARIIGASGTGVAWVKIGSLKF